MKSTHTKDKLADLLFFCVVLIILIILVIIVKA